jgi:hypothetical protein
MSCLTAGQINFTPFGRLGMKKFSISLLCLAILSMSTLSAWAIPPFGEAFKKKYVEGNGNAAFVEAAGAAKCNVCHMGEKKKDKNEYGNAVAKHLKKADFTGDAKKFDPKAADGAKALADGLAAAEAEKSAAGKTFGEIIKGGSLPSK